MTHKRQKQRSNVQGTESPANYQEVISWKYIILLLQDVFVLLIANLPQNYVFKKIFIHSKEKTKVKKNLHLKPHEFLVNHLFIIDLCHQYGIFMVKMEICS